MLNGYEVSFWGDENALKLIVVPWLVWLSWLEHHPIHQKFAGSIPSQGVYLGCGFSWGMRQPINVSVSLSLSLSLSLISINASSGKDFKKVSPWLGWFSGLQTKRSPIQSSVRALDWVAGQVPSRGHARGNHTLRFPSLSPSPSLKIKS